jgi:putative hemolysin
MQEGMRAGAFNRVESEIVSSVLELDQIRVRDLMTPRPKVIFINQDDTHEQVWHKIVVSGHSYFPVYQGNRDHVVGIVSIKSIYANLAAGVGVHLKDLVVPALMVPESLNAIQLLEAFRNARKHLALVADEFGGIAGLVTLNDVMEAVVGDFATAEERARPSAAKRDDGSWLADGLISIEDLTATVPGLKFANTSEFQTLAGYVMKQFGHVPREGEIFKAQSYSWEVLDMDRHRVDKVLILPLNSPPPQ